MPAHGLPSHYGAPMHEPAAQLWRHGVSNVGRTNNSESVSGLTSLAGWQHTRRTLTIQNTGTVAVRLVADPSDVATGPVLAVGSAPIALHTVAPVWVWVDPAGAADGAVTWWSTEGWATVEGYERPDVGAQVVAAIEAAARHGDGFLGRLFSALGR